MFYSVSADKENVLSEDFTPTPNRRPLKTVQNGNIATDGTPLGMGKRTPRRKSSRASTPSVHRLARRLKRQSVPSSLSKCLSVFEDDTKGIFKGLDEGFQLKRNGQELNEMIRDKVSETVVKMKERYEASLAENQQNLKEKNDMIEKLQSEINLLKQSQNDFNHVHKDNQKQENITMFVEQVISKAIHEIELENSSPEDGMAENQDLVSGQISCIPLQSSSPVKRVDTCTTMTPTKFISSNTSPMKVGVTEIETSMTPIVKVHSSTSTTPVKTDDAAVETSPTCMKDAMISTLPLYEIDSTITTSPNSPIASTKPGTTNEQVFAEPITESEKCASPFYRNTATEQALCTPQKSCHKIEENVLGLEQYLTPIQEEHAAQLSDSEKKSDETTGKITTMDAMNTDHSSVHVGTSMTPIKRVDQDTLVSPIQTSNVSITTSPLVAALQPEIISTLPLNQLRAELESAAISNELLRNECDELNGKVERLQLSLNEAKSEADEKCCVMQNKIDNLQSELDEALEKNHEMEMKKPLNVEEYDETISRLQKDILLKEKQITFYTKKASEADNLQQDLRRMYAKYNTEHQLYMTMEQEINGITEKFNSKCFEYDSLERELFGVKDALNEALQTIDALEKVRKEAKENQVKCCVLEEQIETFQSQQRENLEFLEQERKGLEETTNELEQLLKGRTEELEVTQQALVEKTKHYEEMRETVHKLRNQLSDVKDELNAVQSQAYLVMLEQEKELTAVSRILEETWGRMVNTVETCKKQVQAQDERISEKDSEEICTDVYKPSFVYSVLAAVSGTVPQSDEPEKSPSLEETEETSDNSEMVSCSESHVNEKESQELSDDFTLVSRAKAFQSLLVELEGYLQDGNEHAQMIIQRQVDEMTNLEESIRDSKQQYEEKIRALKQELEDEGISLKKLRRENDDKQYKVESLKLELKNLEENFESSRERMKELGNRCCTLIEHETENQVLNDKLRVVNDELERIKQDKSCLEKELMETVEKFEKVVEASGGNDKERQKIVVEECLTELLNKKLHLEKEVEKLRASFTKALKENEMFAQYNARLENKASILGSNLLKAEEEIYRLDDIVDRFCMATQRSCQTMSLSQELMDLLRELNVNME